MLEWQLDAMPDLERLKQINESDNEIAVRQPARRPGSVRRTSSLQSRWRKDEHKIYRLEGRARDMATDKDGQARIVAHDSISAQVGSDRRLLSITGGRREATLAGFAGLLTGGEVRKAMAREMADEMEGRTCLFRLLDDLAGAALMALTAWYGWKGGVDDYARRANVPSPIDRQVAGACLSFVPGSIAMKEDGRNHHEICAMADGPLPFSKDDPDGFHPLVPSDGPDAWRLRRTDVWMEGPEEIVADCWFQDSGSLFGEADRRRIFHEYSLLARIHQPTMTLVSTDVTPHVLPYTTCRASVTTPNILLDRKIEDFSSLVPSLLGHTAGCTHLNDMLRALPDAGVLARSLGRPA